TGMLLREAANNNGRIDFFKYFGRLVRRIFIPLALVVVVTLIAGLLISPVTQHRQLWAEARASLLYFENFELINSQLAYGAAGPETSPFQHIWSLSVQGQFYLLWPFVAIIAVLIAKATKTSAAKIMGILIGIIFLVSFGYAINVGSYNQDEAYLMTTTRAWELALGGLLALAGSSIRLPKALRGFAGWVGVVLIATCGIFLDGAALFPGPWAFWPLAGLILVLISAGPDGGNHDPKGSATHFLSNKPLAWIGDRAYGLYLWHWPLLIYYMEVRDRDAIGVRGAMVILAAAILLASLTYRYVEQPLQERTKLSVPGGASNKRAGTVGIGMFVIAGVTTSLFTPSLDDLDTSFEGLDEELYPGAAQYFMSQPPPKAEAFPSIEDVQQYRPDYAKNDCGQKLGDDPGTDEIIYCDDENAPEHPTATVVLAGGSHAGHLEDAFRALGAKYGWEVLVVVKSSCVFGLGDDHSDSMCTSWNNNFVNWLEEHDVDLVVTPGTRLDRDTPESEYVFDNAPMWWEKISDTGTDLLLVRGTLRNEENIPDCLASGKTAQECGPSKSRFNKTDPLLEMDLPENAYPV